MGKNCAAAQAGHSSPGLPEIPLAKLVTWRNNWHRARIWLENCGIGVPTATVTDARIEALSQEVWSFKANTPKLYSTDIAEQQLVRQHLAFTLFVPGGRADRAHKAVMELTEQGYLGASYNGGWFNDTSEVAKVAAIMRPNVRFYKTKAGYLARALDAFQEVPIAMLNNQGIDEMNRWLFNTIPGLGLKAAAHLMRNLGFFTEDYAYPIIDVHIHKLLEAGNFKHDTYGEAETSFLRLAELTDIPVVLLDAYVWCTYSQNWNPDTADFSNFGFYNDRT
jgi:thermostable 8-oxoguanine DNA glycosylase